MEKWHQMCAKDIFIITVSWKFPNKYWNQIVYFTIYNNLVYNYNDDTN